jgi:pSer/pThr/pTyr-binding forkhead associated (FHA) protein
MVVHNDGQWTLADQQSASGTFVNGKPCLKRVLQDGDQLQFGRVKSTFHVPERYRPRHKAGKTERLLRAVKAMMSLPRAILRRKRAAGRVR